MTDINAWRKRISHPIRSKTPINDDVDDRHSEHGSENSTSRHRSRPKLSRYLSSYLAITAPPKSDEFASDFWNNLGQPLDPVEKVDPYMVVQSIHTMIMKNPSRPIPAAHNSNLLHIIENHRNLCEEKERLGGLLKDTLDGFKEAEQRWITEEHNFRSEIRRLELILARGKQGMTELMRARQGSIIQRKRKIHKTPSEEQLETFFEFLTRDQIDQDNMREGQRVVLTRSKSPSNQMKALSRTLSHMDYHDDLPFGTPPDRRHKHSLSYWAKSNEGTLELTDARAPSQGGSAGFVGPSDDPSDTYSTFSSVGDPLPDEEGDTRHTIVDTRPEGEDFIALRDLVIQVAKRRGMRIETVLPRLVDLLEGKDTPSPQPARHILEAPIGRLQLRQARSQPQLSSDTPRRHFSFDPGDDTSITALDEVALEVARSENRSQDTTPTSEVQTPGSQVPLNMYASNGGGRSRKPSMIPSPTQDHPLAHMRREDSPSSILTSIHQEYPKRTDSGASSSNSNGTTIRHNSSKKHSKRTSNGTISSTNTNKSGAQRLSEQNNSLRSVALAAARAAGSNSGQSSGTESGTTIKLRQRQYSITGTSRDTSSSRPPAVKFGN